MGLKKGSELKDKDLSYERIYRIYSSGLKKIQELVEKSAETTLEMWYLIYLF